MNSKRKLQVKTMLALKQSMPDGWASVTPEAIVTTTDTVVDEWFSEIESEIVRLIKDWEDKMGDDDKTLYSLGLRRALDVVRGEERPLNS